MSFLEKLKKGMGVEKETEIEEAEVEKTGEEIEKVEEKPKRTRRIKNKSNLVEELSIKTEPVDEGKIEEIKESPEKKEVKKIEIKEGVVEKEKVREKKEREKLFETTGELTIDVCQTESDLVIQSAVAGVKPEDLDISIERDILTIKGVRDKTSQESGDYLIQECYWGPFSRRVIFPVEVDTDKTQAQMKEGILTIRIPIIHREKKRKIVIQE